MLILHSTIEKWNFKTFDLNCVRSYEILLRCQINCINDKIKYSIIAKNRGYSFTTKFIFAGILQLQSLFLQEFCHSKISSSGYFVMTKFIFSGILSVQILFLRAFGHRKIYIWGCSVTTMHFYLFNFL